MDDEIKELLEKNLEATEQTLKLVKKMHRTHIRGQIFSIIKWGLIVGVTVFSFIRLQPYLNMLLQTYSNLFNTVQKVQNIQNLFQ